MASSPKPKIAASGASTHESLKDELKISNAELFGSLEKSLPPKKEKKSEKRKNRTQQKRLPKNYETLSDIPKKDP
jgi:hypothetical protein